MKHTDNERLNKAKILATEALRLAELYRNEENEELQAYQLSQVEALARDVICDTGQYDSKDDVEFIK